MGLKDELKSIQRKHEKRETERRETRIEIPNELANKIADNIYHNVLENIKECVKLRDGIVYDYGFFNRKINYRYEVGVGVNGGWSKKWVLLYNMDRRPVLGSYSPDTTPYGDIFPQNNGFLQAVRDYYSDDGDYMLCKNLGIINKVFSLVVYRFKREGVSCDFRIVYRGEDMAPYLIFCVVIPCNKDGDVK